MRPIIIKMENNDWLNLWKKFFMHKCIIIRVEFSGNYINICVKQRKLEGYIKL